MTNEVAQAPESEPRRRPGGRTRGNTERITAATLDLLVEAGYESVTFAAVAHRAGVGRATMYRRWASPADLVGESIRMAAADAIRMPDTGTLRADLVEVLARIGAFVESPVGRAALSAGLAASSGSGSASGQTWAERWEDVRPIFGRAVDRGELPAVVDAEALFAAAAGAVYFRLLVMGETVDRDWIDRIVGTLLDEH